MCTIALRLQPAAELWYELRCDAKPHAQATAHEHVKDCPTKEPTNNKAHAHAAHTCTARAWSDTYRCAALSPPREFVEATLRCVYGNIPTGAKKRRAIASTYKYLEKEISPKRPSSLRV